MPGKTELQRAVIRAMNCRPRDTVENAYRAILACSDADARQLAARLAERDKHRHPRSQGRLLVLVEPEKNEKDAKQ